MSDVVPGDNFQPVGFAFETVTVGATAVGLTVSTYQPQTQGQQSAICAVVGVAVDSIRVRFDGVAPTATVGQLIAAGTVITLNQPSIRLFRAIRDTGASNDAKLSVSYFNIPT